MVSSRAKGRKARFEHLHLHTEYSVSDAVGSVRMLAERAASMGFGTLCVTDHGHLYSLADGYDLPVRYVPGCELYVIDELEQARHKSSHLTVLAASRAGLVSLLKALSESLEYYYYRPRLPVERVMELEDCYVLSGCIQGYCAKPYLSGNEEESLRRIRMLYETLRHRFLLELQAHTDPAQVRWNRFLASLPYPRVVTNDVHFPERQDFLARQIVAGGKAGASDWNPDKGLAVDQLWMSGPSATLKRLLHSVDRDTALDAMQRSAVVALSCHVPLKRAGFRVPGMGGFEKLRGLLPPVKGRVRQRVEYELEVIGRKGFADFFLLVHDIVKYARSQGYYVSNRGSAVSSVVLYLLGVTTLDPLEYGLDFDRFLSPERSQPPDIDLDVERAHRDRILDYVFSRWGPDRVAVLSNVGRYHSLLFSHDLARAHRRGYVDLPFAEDKSLVQAVVESEKWDRLPELERPAKLIVGGARFISVHAGGIVFFPEPIWEYTHLYRTQSTDVAALDKRMAESMELMKLDILSVDTLDVIRASFPKGKDPFRLRPDDPNVYEWLRSHPGEYAGLFQITEVGRRAIERIKPKDFEDLMAVISTIRPGSTGPEEYADGGYMPGPFAEFVRNTNGVLIYQEQQMAILRRAGFSSADVERIMKAIKTRSADEELEEFRERWMDACDQLGVSQDDAEYVWERLTQYGFNRSHAAGYAYLTYLTAWLKTYRYRRFMIEVLRRERNGRKVKEVVREMMRRGVRFLHPCVNRSKVSYSLEEGNVRIGLSQIHGVGPKAARLIVKHAPFTPQSWQEFLEKNRRVVNARVVRILDQAGALEEVKR